VTKEIKSRSISNEDSWGSVETTAKTVEELESLSRSLKEMNTEVIDDAAWEDDKTKLYWDGWDAAGEQAQTDVYHLGWVDRLYKEDPEQASFAGGEEPFPESVLNTPFDQFSSQCSHNTFVWGRQGAGVHINTALFKSSTIMTSNNEKAMAEALELGYRCVEIDVWMRRTARVIAEEKRWDGPNGTGLLASTPGGATNMSRLKILHQAELIGPMTAALDITLFVKSMLEWCLMDEQRRPATPDRPKLPIVISVENHAREDEYGSRQLRDVLSWFGEDRLVLPAEFKQGTTMASLAVKDGPRRIILKGKSHPDYAFAQIVAMNKEASRGTYVSESIKMDCDGISDAQVEKMKTHIKKGTLVRTYPCNFAQSSENYPPGRAFSAKAQMVCVNYQGTCEEKEATCPKPLRGKSHGGTCECGRDYAAAVEAAFMRWGYDGYIHYPTLPSAGMREFQHIRFAA